MVLEKLKEYSDRIDQAPPLYAPTPVAWTVVLNPDGTPVSPHPVSRIDESNRRGKRGREMTAPMVKRSGAVIRPLLLADDGEHTFGRPKHPDKIKLVDARHRAYWDLVERCAKETNEPSVRSVKRFHQLGGSEQLELPEGWDYGLKVAFSVRFDNGTLVYPLDLPSVQRFWLSINQPPSDFEAQCLVCGGTKPILCRLQSKVKGIRGGQASGTDLISANVNAFESYGLRASQTSPICQECAEGFVRGVNALVGGEDTRYVIGANTFVFWTREPVTFRFGTLLSDAKPEQVKQLFDSVRSGQPATVENETAFYALSLSASGSRAVVRDWIDTTVGHAKENMARWFEMQRIIHPRQEDPTGTNPDPLPLFRLAVATVRKIQDLPPTTPRSLFYSVLTGSPLPMELAFQAVLRNRAEQGVRREWAALIKLVLLSRERLTREEGYMVALETEHPDTAYHCGRLLAVIERVQYAALGKTNTTVVDRYYGAASARPAMVFAQLLRGAQPHLSKLDDRRRNALRLRLADVCGQIAEFPKILTLEQQALFSLGYYHQVAHDRAAAMEARSRREAAEQDHA